MTQQTAAQKAAWLKRRKERDWGTPVPEHLRHGTRTMASDIYGCDCRECLPSGRRRPPRGEGLTRVERERRLRKNKRGQPVPPGSHGIYGYKIYGCRCDFCEKANRDASRKQRASWRDTAVAHWGTRGGMDVVHWPPVGEGTWSCPDCGQHFEMREGLRAQAA